MPLANISLAAFSVICSFDGIGNYRTRFETQFGNPLQAVKQCIRVPLHHMNQPIGEGITHPAFAHLAFHFFTNVLTFASNTTPPIINAPVNNESSGKPPPDEPGPGPGCAAPPAANICAVTRSA